ncbi:CRISPR-associated endonuclease Cas2 [Afifella sp. H1R]|uniref:CRISPR-associated endonuclease Cas2 n=1 Tax=unclassified Afifella TaxID=2624128 RepID=UPI001F369E7D|nr:MULTISPECIES: CRISPR-associated endonuclease Cas2 [unclassified Afifella]MCF1504012.1 CRISPR-associated endonuclease Cas2 [Afifella sp. H1R]MCT8268012.1 CRISPR-associated endonuclease Cas2 [Afifella sp. JA880]
MSGRRLYVFAYDIADDRRRGRVASLLESRGLRVQESVFELRETQRGAVALAAQLKKRMRPPDNLRVYPVPGSVLADCIAIGGAPVAEDGDFLIF